MFDKPLAFIDVETTGTHPSHNRVIELGIIRVEKGKIIDQFETLVNPETHVSPFIQSFTGISAEELEGAPVFADIQTRAHELLHDAYFVAHNARFDYGFMKYEFKRQGLSFHAKTLCTVQLSRRLYPQYSHHNLSAIIERMGIECKRRHRAFDDALVLWKFMQKAAKEFTISTIFQVFFETTKTPVNASEEIKKSIENLPETSGVYLMYDKDNLPLYIGKSINIQERVKSHYSQDYTSGRELDLTRETTRIEYVKTAGELGALITESQLVKKLQPIFNRKLRKKKRFIVLQQTVSSEGYLTLYDDTIDSFQNIDLTKVLGIFKTKKSAKETLAFLAKKYQLCQKILGLEKTKSSCFSYKLQQCKGTCIGLESVVKHNARFIIAFLENRLFRPWPFNGPIEITEKDAENGLVEKFIVDKWCLTGRSQMKEESVFDDTYADFDVDIYKILSSMITRKKMNIVNTTIS